MSSQKTLTSQLGKFPPGIPLGKLSLALIDEQVHYRIPSRNGVAFYHAQTGKPLAGGEEKFARQLACEFSGYPAGAIEKTEFIPKFRKDYGFIFKRLPVHRVHYQDQAIWHDTVDTEDAHLAMRTTPARLVEALTFTYLHKFHFLDFAGRNTRDIVTAIAVCSIMLTVFFGLLIALKRRR